MWNTTLETLDDVEPADVAKWSIDVLAQLDAELSALEDKVRTRRSILRQGIVKKYGPNTIGTMTVPDGQYTVKVQTPKNVDWDQAALARLWTDIGASAGEYINLTYGVSETAYKSWPECIRKEFEPARTVRPGTPKVTILAAKKKDAA